MASIPKLGRAMTRCIIVYFAFFAASCADQKDEVIMANLKSGEKVRVVSIDSRPSHPSRAVLCVEILPADGTPSEPDYESFADFASGRAIFDGWTAVELRTSPQVSFQTLSDAVETTSVLVGTDVRLLAPPCPD